MPRRRRTLAFVLPLAAALTLVGAALITVTVAPARARAAAPPERTEPWIDADAPEIRERIERAEERVVAGDLAGAGRIWQELLDLDSPKLIGTSPNTFTGVAEWVRLRLVAGPPEVAAAYRETVEPDARRAFEAAIAQRDEASLARVWRRFPRSPFGARAAFVLADLERRRGDVDRAAARLAAIAATWSAASDGGGSLDPASDIDAAAFERQRAFAAGWSAATAAPDAWPLPGGSADRARVSPLEGVRFELVAWMPLDDGPDDRDPAERITRVTPREATIADGEIRVAGRDRVHRLALKTGERLPDWTRAEHLYKFPEEPLGTLDERKERPHPIVQAGGTAIVVHDFGDDDAANLITGLDLARDAAQRWVRGGGRDLEGRPNNVEDPELADVRFCGSPAIWGSAAYLTAVERTAKVQVIVFAIDLRPGTEGRFLWPPRKVGLGTALGATTSIDANERTRPVEAGTPAIADGVLYVATNVGAVVALDAIRGDVLWLHRYERAGSERVHGDRDRATPAWRTRYPIVADDAVFVTPADCDRLLIYGRRIDAASGGVLRSDLIRRTAPGADSASTDLLGVRDGVVFLTGARIDPDGSPVQARKAWPSGPKDEREDVWSGDPLEDVVSGRGLLTRTHVIVPTEKALYAFPIDGDGTADAATHRAELEGITARIDDTPRRVFGHLTATRDRLVSVTEDGIFLFRPVSGTGGGRTK